MAPQLGHTARQDWPCDGAGPESTDLSITLCCSLYITFSSLISVHSHLSPGWCGNELLMIENSGHVQF